MKMDLEQFDRRVIVTGGAGFIGSNLLMHLVPKYPDYLLVNIDCLTYAANLSNLKPIENSPNYVFERVNICDRPYPETIKAIREIGNSMYRLRHTSE